MQGKEWRKRFAQRTDITSKVVHLTRAQPDNGLSLIDVLFKIIREKKILGSTTSSGFIVGKSRAVCMQDTPLYSIVQNVYYEEKLKETKKGYIEKYKACGLIFPKSYVFNKGGRPVIYDKTENAKQYLPKDQWWRIVNFDLSDKNNIIDWTHEREWRVKGDFEFQLDKTSVILPNHKVYTKFFKKYKGEYGHYPTDDLKEIINATSIFF